ncbi:MAG: MBL fold metallo-hydrolase [Eubacteriales bacterium]
MKIKFIGAAHEVTGSCSYLNACGKNILIDYGMEQGVDYYENEKVPVAASEIDYVLLTHAHIDHSGLLPLLFKEGFRGEIHSTQAAYSLCDIMLRDSAHIQEFEAEWKNRKARRSGSGDFVPIYTMDDAVGALGLFHPHKYETKEILCPGIETRFIDAGHLLGSASIEVFIKEDTVSKKFVFSGDIGNLNQPLLRDPQYIKEADYVLMECTYGDRIHKEVTNYIEVLTDIIQDTFDRGGNLIIPSFAVGRTQEMLYFLRKIKADNLVKGHGSFPVYVDSPLAIEATTIFNKNSNSCFDPQALELINKGINPLIFDGLKLTISTEESKAINFDPEPKIIISASGMCEAGRIRHHLKHNLWREDSTVLFVGYQAQNTLGRALLNGAKSVRLFGEEIKVRAQIKELPGISAHADQNGLIEWISNFSPKPIKVFVNHGESEVCDSFAEKLKSSLNLDAVAPFSGMEYDLATNTCTHESHPVLIQKKIDRLSPAASAFARLKTALDRLASLIDISSGRTNKDLARLTDQINSMCDKWEK